MSPLPPTISRVHADDIGTSIPPNSPMCCAVSAKMSPQSSVTRSPRYTMKAPSVRLVYKTDLG